MHSLAATRRRATAAFVARTRPLAGRAIRPLLVSPRRTATTLFGGEPDEEFGAAGDFVNRIPKTGQVISTLGFGAYRINEATPDHMRALGDAVSAGVNVIDTAAHFGDGASERAVGALLRGPAAPKRDSVYLITKAGFVTPHVAEELARAGVNPDAVHAVGSGAGAVGHTVDPAAIKAQLDGSLGRLGVNKVDLFMLNCPERMLAGGMTAAQLETQLARTFEYLATECEAGRIGGFGVTSTDARWAIPDAVLAKSSDLSKYWHGVQVPANLCETRFLEDKFLDRVMEHDLALFTHRLITAISPRGVLRLATSVDPQYAHLQLPDGDLDTNALTEELSQHLTKLATLEETLIEQVDDSELANRFLWGGVLPETLDKLLANEVGARFYLERQVLAAAREDTAKLIAAAEPAAREEVDAWVKDYLATLTALTSTLTALAHAAGVVHHRSSRDLLALYAPNRWPRDAPLPTVSLALVQGGARAHVPGATLVGMRRPAYVKEMVQAVAGPVGAMRREDWRGIVESGVLEHLAEGGN
ncbi:hypothetical protein H9P43_004369 [Blastocladiella emersonii ATCC 22665]|nr:hypothetical protein H9P43_004369 [Blastocladiella emersonii ATCC 22665]